MATFGPNRIKPYRRTQGNNAWRVVRTATYKFVAFENDTIIYRNGERLVSINAGGNSSQTLTAGDIIYSNKYISMHESGSGNTAIYAAWHGTRFAHRRDRYNVTVYFWHIWPGPEENLRIQIYRDGTSIGSVNLPAGGSGWGSYNIGNTTGNYIFESENNYRFACIAGEFPSSDVMPLYPCDYKDEGPYELYGTASSGGDVIALDNSTTITEYTSGGGVRSFTLNRGGSAGITAGGSQFAGVSTRLVADKPIYASSQADADGGEMTPYVSPEAFGTHAAVPTTRDQFVKLVSNQPAVVNVNGTNRTLTGTNGIYQYYQTGGAPQGAILTSSTPFCAVYESDAEDETILSMWSQENIARTGFGPQSNSNGLVFAFDPENPKCNASSNPMRDAVTGNNYSRTGSPTLGTYGGSTVDVYRFTGTNQYFESGVLDTQPATDLTIEAWIYADSSELSSGDRGTIVRVNGNQSAYMSWNKSNRKLSSYWYSHNPAGYHELLPAMNRNQWYHLVTVWDNSAGVLRQYQNSTGVRASGSTATVGNASTGANVEIGMESTGRQFAGAIGLVRIYNTALTATQVIENYNANASKYGVS